MAVTMDGIFVNGQKALFRPEDIVDGDVSAYAQEVGAAVEEWLEENVTGGEQVTDTTLTLPGVPADAEVTGNKIEELKEDLKEDLTHITGVEIYDNWQIGKGYKLNVTVVSLTAETMSGYNCQAIPCTAKDMFLISGDSGTAQRLWAFVSSTGSVLSVESPSVTIENKRITAPANTAYLLVNWNTSGTEVSVKPTPVLIDNVNALSNDNLAVILDYSNGYLSAQGVYGGLTTSNEKTTDYIPINGAFSVQQWGSYVSTGLWNRICYYNSSKEFLSSVTPADIRASYCGQTFTPPDNTAYVRVSFRQGTGILLMINNGISKPPYKLSQADQFYLSNIRKHLQFTYAPLIIGKGKYIDYDTTNGTITIPNDTVYVDYRADGNKYFKVITTGDSPLVVSGVTRALIGSSAFNLVLDTTTWQVECVGHHLSMPANKRLLANVRLKYGDYSGALSCPYPWSIDGKPYGITIPEYQAVKKNTAIINSVNHRGWHQCPENTIPAYKASKQHGFEIVETDVAFTSDGVAVLLHDETINRTARNADGTELENTVYIANITYEQALAYDFGIYKGSTYANTKIPTLEDFLILCKDIGLLPYIELKAGTSAQIAGLVDIVVRNGMKAKVTWISFSDQYLSYIKERDASARLGYLRGNISSENVTVMEGLKTTKNEVFADVQLSGVDSSGIALLANEEIPLEVWIVDSSSDVLELDPYITGVTSNVLIASDVVYDANKV